MIISGVKASHGGRRKGSGRKPLIDTVECGWIIDRIREVAASDDIMKVRFRLAVKRQNPQFIDAHDDLQIEYSKLRGAPLHVRQAWAEDDAGTPIEEAREIRNEPGFIQLIHVPVPNQFVTNEIYKAVAKQASRHFAKRITPRTVKACANAWTKFELEIRCAFEKTYAAKSGGVEVDK